MLTRQIPRTGEALPVIGMGTYETFDVGYPGEAGYDEGFAALTHVSRAFFAAGGTVIDSSPMYGQSEATVGKVLDALGPPPAFLATKVWTRGKAEGQKQMNLSERLMGRIDLMQIHNLVDWKTHLATLRDWKAAGRIRYIGVTHYLKSSFTDLEQIIRSEAIDFVQLPYSLSMRDAEERLLPAAADHQTAVLVMLPFAKASMFARVHGRPLPGWTHECDATTWAELFLKFILAHPAVTAPIPATGSLAHMQANLKAGEGRPLADEHRRQLIEIWESL